MRSRGTAALALALIALAGCGASATTPGANPAPTTALAGGCPTSAAPTKLPADVPTVLPLPTGGTLISESTTPQGVHIVRFATTLSLRQGVLFILDRYPKAGFVLARGDAEATEADAPFANQSGTFRGALRLTSSEPCATTWLIAYAETTAGQTGPALPSYKPTSSASPLPFS